MVKYQIRTSKAPRGYNVSVSVHDGIVLKPLVRGIHRLFEKWEEQYESKKGGVDGFVENARSESKRLRNIQQKQRRKNK